MGIWWERMAMQIFYGTFYYRLDEKSRLVLPQKMREIIGGKCFVTKGFDHCLRLYPEEAFIALSQKMSQYGDLTEEERNFRRTFFSTSNDYSVDKVGRITLSEEHLSMIDISKDKILKNDADCFKDIAIVGNFDHVELWNKEQYLAMMKKEEEDFEKNAKTIASRKEKDV